MGKLLLSWIVSSLAIYALPQVVSGVAVDSFAAALAAAAVLAVLNFLVKPLLILLTLPLTVLSLGFFLLVLNGIIFYWVGSLVEGVHVASFGAAFVGSLLISLVHWAFQLSFRSDAGGRRVIVVRPPGNSGDRPTRDLN